LEKRREQGVGGPQIEGSKRPKIGKKRKNLLVDKRVSLDVEVWTPHRADGGGSTGTLLDVGDPEGDERG